MRLTMIPIIVGALGTILKGLEKGEEEFKIKGRIETTSKPQYYKDQLESSGDLKRLVGTQNSLVRKTCKE